MTVHQYQQGVPSPFSGGMLSLAREHHRSRKQREFSVTTRSNRQKRARGAVEGSEGNWPFWLPNGHRRERTLSQNRAGGLLTPVRLFAETARCANELRARKLLPEDGLRFFSVARFAVTIDKQWQGSSDR